MPTLLPNGLMLAAGGVKQEAIIWENERGLLYRNGRYERLLTPGRYEFWRWEKVRITRVSARQMSEVINGQEILTSDKIEVRISLVAQYIVTDPPLAINSVESFTELMYQELQLGLREAVASRTIDQLLEAREEIGVALLALVAPSALTYGVTLRRVGIRDIVLPGVVRTVFLKEVEADRTGRADLVRARHEIAAARTRANTARILSENPNVARMQEIDALVSLAGKPGNVVLLPNLADMLVPRAAEATTNGNGTNHPSSGE
ncbi:MAG TPA: slipin family protein [Aggregatilineales bacterium]|nr:slipin family protein [Aggregatilineales bacterium]